MSDRLAAAFVALTSVVGCSSPSKGPPTSLPQPGPDASFAGVYDGNDEYVASLDIGSELGADFRRISIDDASTNSNLTGDELLFHYEQNGASCDLPGVVTARRYDASGGSVQLPITVATATIDVATCVLTNPGSATVGITEGEAQLYADGSIDLTFAGTASSWGGRPATGTARWTYSGKRSVDGGMP